MVDEQDLHPLPDPRHVARHLARIACTCVTDCRNHRRCLQFGFCLFFMRIAVVQERRTGAHLGDPVLDADGSQRQPGVHVAVEADHADRSAIPGAWALLVVLDEAHRPEFRRAGHGHGPGVAEEAVEGIHVLAQPPLDVIDRVDQPGVHLDLPPPDDLHRAWLADARLVVAVDIGAHRQLALVLLGVEELEDLLRVGDRILAAPDRPGDRAGLDPPARYPHEHFRRGAHQIFLVPEVDEEGIGRRIDRLQPVGDLRRLRVAALHELLSGHHFEQVAAAEALLRLHHQLRIFAGLVVALRRRHGRALERLRRNLA